MNFWAIIEQGEHAMVVYFNLINKLLKYYVNIDLEDLVLLGQLS
ncbi:hypothetical protein [Aquisalibacillus elongatus]|nr:hypothetical protein [Aquisalibacillus elongatus]